MKGIGLVAVRFKSEIALNAHKKSRAGLIPISFIEIGLIPISSC
jgi:hypothetical protein